MSSSLDIKPNLTTFSYSAPTSPLQVSSSPPKTMIALEVLDELRADLLELQKMRETVKDLQGNVKDKSLQIEAKWQHLKSLESISDTSDTYSTDSNSRNSDLSDSDASDSMEHFESYSNEIEIERIEIDTPSVINLETFQKVHEVVQKLPVNDVISIINKSEPKNDEKNELNHQKFEHFLTPERIKRVNERHLKEELEKLEELKLRNSNDTESIKEIKNLEMSITMRKAIL